MNRWPKFGVIAFCVIGFDPAWVRADEGEQPPAPEEAKASYVQSGVIQPQLGQGLSSDSASEPAAAWWRS